jgi:23S rRNA pseudouridine2605 synthase
LRARSSAPIPQSNLALQRIAEDLPPPRHKRSTDEVFSEPQRLHKVLASCGFGSRRAMEEMILAGRITVNRLPAEVGQKVGPGDEVRINGDLVKVRFTEPRARVLMYHKPAGELVTRDDPEGRPTVFEKLPSIGTGKWINVGRLDYNTEGLLLFTNSGELANRMMHPRFEVEREYAVRIMGRLTDEQLQQLTSGVQLEDGPAKVDSVEDAGGDDDGANHWYKVVLHEGRNREVRRLFEALGVMVSRLIRTRYGVVQMPTVLKRGDLLELEPTEVARVLDVAGIGKGGNASPPRRDGHKGTHGQPKGLPRQGTQAVPGPRQGGEPGAERMPHRGHGHGRPGKPFGKGGPAFGNGDKGGHGFAKGGQGFAKGGQGFAKGGPGFAKGGPGFAKGGQGFAKGGQGFAKGGQGFAKGPGQRKGPGKGPRPNGASAPQGQGRVDYDERQPVSNENASPFERTTLTIPGGMPLRRPAGEHGGPPGVRKERHGHPGGRPGQGQGRKGAGATGPRAGGPAGRGPKGGPRGAGQGGNRAQGQGAARRNVAPGTRLRTTSHGSDRLYERGTVEPRADERAKPRRVTVVAHKRHRVIPQGAMPPTPGAPSPDDES